MRLLYLNSNGNVKKIQIPLSAFISLYRKYVWWDEVFPDFEKINFFSPLILTPDGEDMEKLKRIQNFKGIDDIDKVCIEK